MFQMMWTHDPVNQGAKTVSTQNFGVANKLAMTKAKSWGCQEMLAQQCNENWLQNESEHLPVQKLFG